MYVSGTIIMIAQNNEHIKLHGNGRIEKDNRKIKTREDKV